MDFNYKLYVNRFKYQPYHWPPDISLAQLHSRCSQQGIIHQNSVKCPCCGVPSKQKYKSWLMRNIDEDCSGFGSAVPAYFGLLKYYTFAILAVILINGIYPLYVLFYTCMNYSSERICLHVGAIYYLDFDTMVTVLLKNGDNTKANNLLILETVTFYLLLFVNISSLFYLAYMEKKENLNISESTLPIKNALIIENLKSNDIEKIKKSLEDAKTRLDIAEIINLKPYKTYLQLFNKRNKIYFSLTAKVVVCQDPKSNKALNKKLKQVNQLYRQEKKKIDQMQFSNLLVIFKTSAMANLIRQYYTYSEFGKIIYGTKQIACELKISKQILDLPLNTVKVPNIRQIRWQNAGESSRQRLSGRIKAFFIAIGIIIICYLFLALPMKWSLLTHTEAASDLKLFEKILPFLISIVLFIISVLYRNYMVQVSMRRNPLNEFAASKFVLMSTVLFHLVFYIIIPTVFFSVPNSINQTIKLYVIADQARTFVIIQLIISIIDVPYQTWKNKKVKNLSDQRQGFKYCQKALHKTVEYRDFPLELRLQIMFKIWSFALFYAFYLPYMMIYMLVALVILYILEKRNLYFHYTLRRAISLKLQKTFLTYFVNFFCLFQCFVYCLHSKYTWMIYTSIPITLVLLILTLVYWKAIQPKIKEDKEKGEDIMESLLAEHLKSQKIDFAMQSAKETGRLVRESYQKFINSIQAENLDKEVDLYLNVAGSEIATKNIIQTLIQLTDTEKQDLSD